MAMAVLKAGRDRHRHSRSARVALTLISCAEWTLPRIASWGLAPLRARHHPPLQVGP